ncbi:hypothetical protein B484DRAFT_405509 [Ochromonadaceae sp. CCMP2298]|nr:hypothetical protein B484DRAFT_405509 [Ochromonadaceae sp. CCMP2298]
MLKQVLREEAGNDFLDWDFSDSWLQKVKQQFLTASQPEKELFYSSDDESVLLNKMNDKPKVITTKAAKAVTEKQGLVISATTDKEKQRVVTFNITISGGGSLVCKMLKFADRDFTQFAEKPFKVCMDEHSDADRMFIMLYQYGIEDAKVEEAMYRKCILPEQQQPEGEDEEVEGQDEHEMEAVLPEVQEEGAEGPQRFRNCAAMFCDGAFGQIAALRLAVSRQIETKLMVILLGKYAGGCSITQSGNNNGQMHLTLHGSFKSPSFRCGKVKDRPGPTWKDPKILMQLSIDPASVKSVWKCMQHSQHILIKALTPPSFKSAFRKIGVDGDPAQLRYGPPTLRPAQRNLHLPQLW